MKGIITSKKEVAKGTLETTFSVEEEVAFTAGQFIFVTLPELHYPDDRGNRRHFSIVNSPTEKGIIRFTTRVRESGYKQTLKELPEGTQVELGPIGGDFVLPEDTQQPLVFIAGGIGITPYMSMLQYMKDKNLSYNITLIYSNRDQQSTVYFNQLNELAKEIPNLKVIFVMTQMEDWNGEKGHIDVEFIKRHFPDVNSQKYFVVGPPVMSDALVKVLGDAGVVKELIKQENFSGY